MWRTVSEHNGGGGEEGDEEGKLVKADQTTTLNHTVEQLPVANLKSEVCLTVTNLKSEGILTVTNLTSYCN